MKFLKKMFLPLLAVVINIVLAANTGFVIFYLMAAVILLLVIANVRQALRNGSDLDAQK